MSVNKNSRKNVRYAVVGIGHLAQVAILPAFRTAKYSELVTIVSGDAEKREELGKKYDLRQVYSYEDYEKALSSVDAVYIVLPNHMHKEYAVKAARAGVHVLCEKPMAVTEQECEDMIEAAKENNVKLMIAYRLHFEKANLEAVQLATNGKLGELRAFTSEFGQMVADDNIRLTAPIEKGGGPLYDMGIYCINASRYLFRDEPTEVLATTASSDDPKFLKAGEMVSAVLHYPKHRVATFTCSFGSADVGRYTLIGTKGLLTAEPAYEYAMGLKHRVMIGDQTIARSFPKRDQFAAELTYFSGCIRKNKQPEPSGVEGLADVRIVRAIYRAAETGKKVELEPFQKEQRPTIQQEIQMPAHGKPKTLNAESPSGEAALT